MKRFASAVGLMAALAMAASPVLAGSYRSPSYGGSASRISFGGGGGSRYSSPSPSYSSPRAGRITFNSSPAPTPSSPPRASRITPAPSAPSGGLNLSKNTTTAAPQANTASRINVGSTGASTGPAAQPNRASRIAFSPSPTASRFASSPQYRSYTTHVHIYHYTPGGYYHYSYAPLIADPYYGALHYGSVYHYGAYDYMPVLAAAGVLTAIVAMDSYGHQHRIDCNAPVTQADFDTCASARQSLGVPAAYAAPADYSAPAPVATPAYAPAPVVVHQGIGLGGAIFLMLLAAGLVGGGFYFYRRRFA